jgi:flagellar biosynthesis protein FliR
MSLRIVSMLLEMDIMSHQNVSIDVRDKLKCCMDVPIYQYIDIPSVSLKCLYVRTYTIGCLYNVTLHRI